MAFSAPSTDDLGFSTQIVAFVGTWVRVGARGRVRVRFRVSIEIVKFVRT